MRPHDATETLKIGRSSGASEMERKAPGQAWLPGYIALPERSEPVRVVGNEKPQMCIGCLERLFP